MENDFKPLHRTFPATELKAHAEPVGASEMRENRVYFALQFLDQPLFVPVLQPLIFLGTNLSGNAPEMRYFQHLESFIAGVRYQTRDESDKAFFEIYGPDEGQHIFDYDHALKRLMFCGLRRNEASNLDESIYEDLTSD